MRRDRLIATKSCRGTPTPWQGGSGVHTMECAAEVVSALPVRVEHEAEEPQSERDQHPANDPFH
jgi:hypothetical protein